MLKANLICVTFLLAAVATQVAAQIPPDPNLILDRDEFEANADIYHFADFEEFGTGFSYPPDPWTHEGVTYVTGDNLIVGTATSYSPISNIFCFNGWTPLPAIVSSAPYEFDLLGFDVGYIGRNDPIDIRVVTNLNVYEYLDLPLQNWSVGSDFFGFKAPGIGEYVTDFVLNSDGSGSAPSIDNVTLAIMQIEVAIDIKFCSDPNAFNCKKNGVLPVTIFGTMDFDVESIDISTLQLCTADLSVCTNAPRDWSIFDRGAPSDAGVAQCDLDPATGEELDFFIESDGYLDLDVAFEASEVIALLGDFCDDAAKGDVSEALVIIGETYDGVPIYSVPAEDNTGIDRLVKANK